MTSVLRELYRRLRRDVGLRIHTPDGYDIFRDMRWRLPGLTIETVFDVGANVGDTTQAFLKRYPQVRVTAFEPVGETFRMLQARFAGERRVSIHPVALGAGRRAGRMAMRQADLCSLLAENGEDAWTGPTEAVEVETLDGFAERHGVTRISYLKVDTEGGDLEVLRGAAGLLGCAAIDLVEVECGMHPRNDRHVPFEQLKGWVEEFGYNLFGLYEQAPEWYLGEPQIRRVNAVFISPDLIAAHRRRPSPCGS